MTIRPGPSRSPAGPIELGMVVEIDSRMQLVQGQLLDQHELITYRSNCETMSSLTNVHGTVLQVKQF